MSDTTTNTSAAEKALINAARELIAAGWTRQQLSAFIKEGLPPFRDDDEKRRLAQRDINAMIDLLSGMRLKDVRAKYDRPNVGRGGAILNGKRKAADILNLSSDDWHSARQANDSDEQWIAYGRLALEILAAKSG